MLEILNQVIQVSGVSPVALFRSEIKMPVGFLLHLFQQVINTTRFLIKASLRLAF